MSNPFKGNPFKRVFKAATGVLHQGWEGLKDTSDFGYNLIGTKSPDEKKRDAAAAAGADAAAEAAIKQAEFEASAKAGRERLALRRKRGFGASMLVDPYSALGASSTLGA